MSRVAIRDHVHSRLSAFPLFSELPSESLEALAGMVQFRRFPKGTLIIGQAEAGTCMYLLVSGRVKVSLTSPDGRELVLNYLESPAHFGEMSLVDTQPRSADVVAVTDVELFSLDSKDLYRAIQLQPMLAISIIATLSRRLRHMITRLEDMAFHDARHRVMRVLLNTATASFEVRGVPVIQGMTHYDIATLAGTSRETASRIISQLAREDMLTTKGRRIYCELSKLSDALTRS